MIVSLYTSRVVLKALGFADYGIYAVVGSLFTMFYLFSSTFSTATERFLNFEKGRGSILSSRKVYSASYNIYILLACILLLFFETIGLWFLNYELSIPDGRLYATNIVYQLFILSFVISLVSIPYHNIIIANERMNVFAYVSIYEAIAKLLVAFFITYTSYDALILYTLLLVIVSLSVRLFYRWYCRRFEECKRIEVNDNELYKSMLSLSWWNLVGAGAGVLTSSGSSLVLNIFTNVVINSAKGISSQVEGAVNALIGNFIIAIKPQIVKSYAKGEKGYLISLISKGTRFAFILTVALCAPIICFADVLLKIWLGEIPTYTTEFVRISLLALLIFPFATILDVLLIATGKIRRLQIIIAIIQLLNLPSFCLILYYGFPPYYIYLSTILFSIVSLGIRIGFAATLADISISFYYKDVLKPIFLASFASSLIISPFVYYLYDNSIIAAFFVLFIVEIVILLISWFMILREKERLHVITLISQIRSKYN